MEKIPATVHTQDWQVTDIENRENLMCKGTRTEDSTGLVRWMGGVMVDNLTTRYLQLL